MGREPSSTEHERGATAVEYAIIASLITAVIVLVVTALGLGVEHLFQTTVDAIGSGF